MDKEYLIRKLKGGFLGRAVGETLGRPYIGSHEPLELDFYNPELPKASSCCSLDFHTLWLRELQNLSGGPVVDRDFFAQSWLEHVKFFDDEYGLALRNLKNNILPPWSGSFDSFFCDSMGAALRADLWACLSPAKMEKAVQFAYEDACVDHGADGIHAALFLAALESEAFIENDIDKLLDSACEFIPNDSRFYAVVEDARRLCRKEKEWAPVRKALLAKYACENLTDSVMNFGFIVTALILGEGDFEKSILIVANCAKNTAANTAIVGQILGILEPEKIPKEWLEPISQDLVLNSCIANIEPFETISELTEAIVEVGGKIQLGEPLVVDAPSWEQYLIPVECGISLRWLRWNERLSSPDMECMKTRYTFPGCFNYLDSYEVPANSLYMMRFRFTIEERKQIRVIFNSNSISRVWLDGEFAFGRDGGWMSPSYSTVPLNQYVDVEVEAGIHELIAGVAPNQPDENIYWVMGVAGCADKQWLPFAFFNAVEGL